MMNWIMLRGGNGTFQRLKKKKKEQLKDSDQTLEADSCKKILIKRPSIWTPKW